MAHGLAKKPPHADPSHESFTIRVHAEVPNQRNTVGPVLVIVTLASGQVPLSRHDGETRPKSTLTGSETRSVPVNVGTPDAGGMPIAPVNPSTIRQRATFFTPRSSPALTKVDRRDS
jgi:hypothetical protein